jgi:hypothetical protein
MGDGLHHREDFVILALQLAGASLLVLTLFHITLWRALHWGSEIVRLSPINTRVFIVHLLFIAFVLGALGLLSLVRPDLLLAPSELARFFLYAVVLFWIARLLMQPLVFDRVLKQGWTAHPLVRWSASLLWAGYVAVYGAALLRQFNHP